jgi:hypothetical protein
MKSELITQKEWHDLKKKARILKEAAEAVRVEDKDLVRTIERFQKDIEEMKKKK